MDGAAGSHITDHVQAILCVALDFVREALLVAISSCWEEDQRLDLAWLQLKRTICRTRSLFQHLQVGGGKGHAAVFTALSDGT